MRLKTERDRSLDTDDYKPARSLVNETAATDKASSNGATTERSEAVRDNDGHRKNSEDLQGPNRNTAAVAAGPANIEDMQSIMERLQKFAGGGGSSSSASESNVGGRVSSKSHGGRGTSSSGGNNSEDVSVLLARRALKLGSAFAAAENHMNNYKSLAEG
jgi:hypothetical protein